MNKSSYLIKIDGRYGQGWYAIVGSYPDREISLNKGEAFTVELPYQVRRNDRERDLFWIFPDTKKDNYTGKQVPVFFKLDCSGTTQYIDCTSGRVDKNSTKQFNKATIHLPFAGKNVVCAMNVIWHGDPVYGMEQIVEVVQIGIFDEKDFTYEKEDIWRNNGSSSWEPLVKALIETTGQVINILSILI